MGNKLFITNWFEYSLIILPFEEGKNIMKLLTKEQVTLLPEGRRLERFLYGGAEVVSVNLEGRFLLPQHLKKHAQIQKEVVFRGVGDRIELWSQESYERYGYLTEQETREAAQELYLRIKK
jgi:MraZ protein